jgi:Leu/Phe-tRNA-protein transferase
MSTAHLASLGAREISRTRFLEEVARLVRRPSVRGDWAADPDLAETLR